VTLDEPQNELEPAPPPGPPAGPPLPQAGSPVPPEEPPLPAEESQAPRLRKAKRSPRRLLIEYAATAVVALVVAFLVQAYVVKPYRVPTPSMATTIQPGDRVLIDRLLFDSRSIGRSDIVVFEGPAAVGNQVLLKRVVGLPGDLLEVTDGVLYVNGVPDDAGGVTNADGETPTTEPAYGQLEEHPEWSLHEPYTVPDDHYFLLGDNRGDSFDSRFWGPVPRSSIIGKAFAVYWPLTEVRTLE
jgi:signal peptidase I